MIVMARCVLTKSYVTSAHAICKPRFISSVSHEYYAVVIDAERKVQGGDEFIESVCNFCLSE